MVQMGIKDYVRGFTHDGNFILLARVGSESIENYSVQYTDGKFWANENVHVIRSKKGLDNRFLFHYLSNLEFSSSFGWCDECNAHQREIDEDSNPSS